MQKKKPRRGVPGKLQPIPKIKVGHKPCQMQRTCAGLKNGCHERDKTLKTSNQVAMHAYSAEQSLRRPKGVPMRGQHFSQQSRPASMPNKKDCILTLRTVFMKRTESSKHLIQPQSMLNANGYEPEQAVCQGNKNTNKHVSMMRAEHKSAACWHPRG